jgi:HEPN domain-containing protein
LVDFRDLRELALENLQTANLALENELFNTALENCHYALEKIMKSAIYKEGGNPPTTGQKGHNLVEIANTRVNGRKYLHNAIKSDRNMLRYWTQVSSFWKTHHRYEKLNIDPLDMDDIFDAYEGLVRWIDKNLID